MRGDYAEMKWEDVKTLFMEELSHRMENSKEQRSSDHKTDPGTTSAFVASELCDFCGNKGHKVQFCYKYKSAKRDFQSKSSNKVSSAAATTSGKPTNDKTKVECFRCKKKGHYMRECPTNKGHKANPSVQFAIVGAEKMSTDWTSQESNPHPKDFFFAIENAHLGSLLEQVSEAPASHWIEQHDATSDIPECDQVRPIMLHSLPSSNELKNESIFSTIGGHKMTFLIDSGASKHMTGRRDAFCSYSTLEVPIQICVANNVTKAIGSGEIPVIGGKISNVLYVEGLNFNLLSVSQLIENGNRVDFKSNMAKVTDKQGSNVFNARLTGGTYQVELTVPQTKGCTSVVDSGVKDLWHRRFCHANPQILKRMVNEGSVSGMQSVGIAPKDCEPCLSSKSTKKSVAGTGNDPAKLEIMEIIAGDVVGPFPVRTLNHHRYYVNFIDLKSSFQVVHLLAEKSEAFQKFKETLLMMENLSNKKAKFFLSDNGGEFVSIEFDKFLAEKGIVRRLTTAYTPELNGSAEREHRTLGEKSRAIRLDAGLPKSFWGFAVLACNFVGNRTLRDRREVTPFENFLGKKPSVKMLRVFGSLAWVHDHRPTDKLSSKAQPGIFIGYADNAWLFMNKNKKIIRSRDVRFLEFKRAGSDWGALVKESFDESDSSTLVDESDSEGEVADTEEVDGSLDVDDASLEGRPVRSQEAKKRPDFYGDYQVHCASNVLATDGVCVSQPSPLTVVLSAASGEGSDSPTLQQAMKGPEREQWLKAMADHFEKITQNKTWKLVKLPPGRKAIPGMWVLVKKYDATGVFASYKARYVVNGSKQIPGIDFKEVFAETVFQTSTRVVLTVALTRGLMLFQFDVCSAYLQADIEEDVYVFQPPMFKEEGAEDLVGLLGKGLPGTRQGGAGWKKKRDKDLASLGYQKLKTDTCVFVRKNVILVVYVDDILAAVTDERQKDEIFSELSAIWEIKDLGPASLFVGWQITQKKDSIDLSQSTYLKKILKKFSMEDTKSISIPVEYNVKLARASEGEKPEEDFPYAQLVGSLLWAAVGTRPDLSFAVNLLSRFQGKPLRRHWLAGKRVLRYIAGTIDETLHFTKSQSSEPLLQVYVDADWGGDEGDRKSTTGYVVLIDGNPVSWRSRKQPTVALSTCEAEFMAMTDAISETLFIRSLLTELGFNLPTTKIFEDNQGAIQLAKNPVHHSRSKHIDIKYHFIRKHIEDGVVELEYVQSANQVADMCTKGLPAEPLQRGKKSVKLY
jgi:hypothetical protein